MPVTGSKSTNYKLFENGEYNDELMCQLGSNYDDPIWEDLISQITRPELEKLVGDAGFKTEAIESIGKVKCVDVDGPSGLNANNVGGTETLGGIGSQTAYPIEVVVASTWNDVLVFNFGQMVGSEAAEANISGWYAPGANIHRNQFEGRNFEYYSEDAFLSGKMCAYEVYGCLTKGLYSYIKHFAVNETEEQRSGLYTWLSEQALREIYLRPFEKTVIDGNAMNAMASFTRIGARYCPASKELLTDFLRGELGMKGLVVTDMYSIGYKAEHMPTFMMAGVDIPDGELTNPYKGFENNLEFTKRMREAAKRVLYATVHSNAMNGISKNTKLIEITPSWMIALVSIDGVVAALWVAGVSLAVVAAIKSNKQRKGKED